MSGLALLASLGAILCTIPASTTSATAAPDCTPLINVEPLSAGLSRLLITVPCLMERPAKLQYGELEIIRNFDANGQLSLLFNCFLGDKIPLTLFLPDGRSVPIQLRTLDLDRVTIVAVVWRGSVNLDLHAFEYAAGLSDENHVWAGAPSSRWGAEERKQRDHRGHGFLSVAGEGLTGGDQLEAYTFVHEASQSSGAVTLALDYESRARHPPDPDTCGTGLYADLEYRIFVWHPNGHVSRSRGSFAPLECNQIPDQVARFYSKALPQLFLTR
jgi:hypothetical protein